MNIKRKRNYRPAKANALVKPRRAGALGAREARLEKKQRRAVLAAIWGLLQNLNVEDQLMTKKPFAELDQDIKRSIGKALLELCSAQRRVSISAIRWSESNELEQWDWNELKRATRNLDKGDERSLTLRKALTEQLKSEIDNAPRSYADELQMAQTSLQIHKTIRGIEKAQRAQLTRLLTEVMRAKSPWQSPGREELSQKIRFNKGLASPNESFDNLVQRLKLEIERAKGALGNFSDQVAHALSINGKNRPSVKTAKKTPSIDWLDLSMGTSPRRRGRPPLNEQSNDPMSALFQAQKKWEQAYEDIKNVLRGCRRNARKMAMKRT